MMVTERMLVLLKNASRCFEECYSPFVHPELSKHNVTADECKELSSWIAAIIADFVEVSEAGRRKRK